MIPRPTIAQLLRDCRREITESLVPELSTDTAKVAAEQLDIILEQCAVRADHEIAWMREEIDAMAAYATDVTAALGDDATQRALADATANRDESLHVEDVGRDYHRTSEAFSCALEASVAAKDDDLEARGLELLLRYRKERQLELMANWRLVGRG
ncbi:MAG: hypothetical protein AAGF02_16955 [Actinomycetota bacterium]